MRRPHRSFESETRQRRACKARLRPVPLRLSDLLMYNCTFESANGDG